MAVTVTRTFPASPKTVYYMLTNEDGLAYWFADRVYTRVSVGGHLLFTWANGWHVSGIFTELKENEVVGYTWQGTGETFTSQITFQLEAVDSSTRVTVTQTGLPEDKVTEYEDGWNSGFNTLHTALTTGADLRITERILIGIYMDEFNEKIAQKLNLPFKDGLLVANVIPGLGAEKAGIKSGDFVIEANGKPVLNNTPLTGNFAGLKPDDSAEVVFYRGGEKHTVTLTLSGYPLPFTAESFTALADHLQTDYAKLHAELTEILANVSEETSNTPPADAEWSVNQVLAHLLLSERNSQEFLGCYVQPPELHSFTGNASARVNAVVTTYGSTKALLNELKRAYAETVAIVRAFEAENFDRPYILWWTNFRLADVLGGHNRQHINQIKDTLAQVTK